MLSGVGCLLHTAFNVNNMASSDFRIICMCNRNHILFPKWRNTGVSQMNRTNYTNTHSETYTAAVDVTIIVLVKSENQYSAILPKRYIILLANRIF